MQNLPECDRLFFTLCYLRLCGSLKRAIAKSRRCDRYLKLYQQLMNLTYIGNRLTRKVSLSPDFSLN
ncbi:hypothetical protein [Nostoc flagelliforme]|uniref:hypothetical protein n=1 Tax=Nostoc flagelliforme TaxID=1306274 RepID=UPI0012FE5A1D